MTKDSAPLRTVAGVKAKARAEAFERHNGELPEGFRFYFRRYGKHGGRWRGVGPNGWCESTSEEAASDETWWMVAAYEADQRAGVR